MLINGLKSDESFGDIFEKNNIAALLGKKKIFQVAIFDHTFTYKY
jgi:hypothetical protein